MTCEKNGLVERFLECEKKLEECDNESQSWTDSLEELSTIKDAFVTEENNRLDGKTILDIGTDCVKPLYIALKFEPDKIIGIDEHLLSIASDIKLKSRLLTKTKIGFYDCSFFDEEGIRKIREKEGIDRFDFILVSKTLHHLRTRECIAKDRDDKHKHQKDETEKCCIYGFDAQSIFEKLLGLGKRVIIYEFFDASDTDDDKKGGRGGYFTPREWKQIFSDLLSGKYEVEFIRPEKFHLGKETLNKVDSILRQVDCICFYVEEQRVKDAKNIKRNRKEG